MSDQSQYPYQPQPQMPRYPQGSAEYQMQQPAFHIPVAPDGRPLAGAGQRLGARVIDTLIVMLAIFAVAGAIAGTLVALLPTDDGSPLVPIVVISVIVVIVLGGQYLYEVEVPLRWNGQTPGKRILKIAIARLEPNVPLARGALAGRFGIMMLFNLLSNCYVGLLDPLWCLWDKPYRQCLHDKPAKTVVVKVDPAAVPGR